MILSPVLGALAQASDALTLAAADPQSGAEAAVDTTIDVTLLFLGPIIGACLGVVASIVLSVLARRALAKSAMASSILNRVRRPAHFAFATWGAWVGLGIALVNPRLTDWGGASVTTFLMHLLLIVGLACMTWMGYSAAWVFEDAAKARQTSDNGLSRRFETRAQVLRRFAQVVIAVVGTLAIIGTFEAARHAMTTVLASAGVISVIFGLAAQQTLGNVFAGLQLAFTDAIRVGDVVVAGDKKETGSVEEITLSYVVVRIWDERRLIIPCRYFTQTPFENWTRRAAAQLGTVELKLDWSAPMTLIRAKVEKLLAATDLWDGRTWGVQITASDEYTVTVRVLASAKNSGDLSDLRAYLREHLITWIVTEEPWARPAQRIEPLQTVAVEQDMSRERIARLAAELAGISGTNEAVAATGSSSVLRGAEARESAGGTLGGAAAAEGAAGTVREQPKDAAHAARMVAARRKAKRARRRAMADRQRELADGKAPAPDETQVISKSALRKIIEAAGNKNPQLTQTLTATSIGRGERFFSGSADADERAAALSGPGEEVFAEREAHSRRVKERHEARKRRADEALDDEATAALAAVGVEPVEFDRDTEAVEQAQNERTDAQAEAPAEGSAPEAPVAVPPAPAVAGAGAAGSVAAAAMTAANAAAQAASAPAEDAESEHVKAESASEEQDKPAESTPAESTPVETGEVEEAAAPVSVEDVKASDAAAADAAAAEAVEQVEPAPETEPIEPAAADSDEPVKAEDAACVEPEVEVVEASDPAAAEAVEQVEPAAETEPIEPAVADSDEPVKAEDAACVEPEVEVVEASDPAVAEAVEQVEPAAETEPIEPAVADSDEADKPEDATPDEQATDGAPERETFVKQDDQELPTAETGNTGTANMVFAGRPALVPPPAPTPAEMAASNDGAPANKPEVQAAPAMPVAQPEKPEAPAAPAQPETPAAQPETASTPEEQEQLDQSEVLADPEPPAVPAQQEEAPAQQEEAVAPEAAPEPPPAPAQQEEAPVESSPEPAQEEQTPDEPSIHPGWYAVAEEARLEEEIRPTPKMAPPRVSIMDFFPAVAPTGAEAAMLRAVTGQMPVVGDHKEDEESASTDEAVVSSLASAGSGDSAKAEPANAEPTKAEPAQAVAADSESTQVLPTLEEPPVPDETLVMATAEQVPTATQAAQKSSVGEDASTENADQKETSAEGPGSSKAVEPVKSAESGEEKSENAPASKGSSKKGGSKKGSKKKGSGKKRKSKKK
ncbi:mechanosensitive ion channel [Pauljensenia sp. 20925_1_34]|uniref:mechanosensitive ion channel family protein n=1 Tax=Pauljensenia sp. 20925_1_34 TaxID=3003674 RepID=UPI00352E4BCC